LTVQTLIKNGQLVTPTTTSRGHVVIDQGRIAAILRSDSQLPDAQTVIDADGLHVLPGLIDPHVHFRVPGLEYKEDFRTGSAGAVCGGITTVIDMPNVLPPTATAEALDLKFDAIRGQSHCDYGIYGALVEGSGPEISRLADKGVCGFKLFMGETTGNIQPPSDGEIIDLWRIVASTGLRCGVHAEDNSILIYLRRKLQEEGRADPLAFLESRPPVAEVEAIQRAILFAREAQSKLMIHHISSKQGAQALARAKAEGSCDVAGETAPHYLFLDGRDMVRLGLGSMLRMNPPVRESEHGDFLMGALLDGTVDVLGSDHSPHTRDEKHYDDRMGDIWGAASGWAGVETIVSIMLTAVNQGKLSINQYVGLQAENPARCWDLYPRKGTLDPGSDGDVTVVDLDREGVINELTLHSKNGWTPWHGWHVKGMPAYTVLRGTPVAKDGQLTATVCRGQFVRPSN